MKKVRYALGAVGVVPAIGMMAPVAAPAQATATAAKTVSLQHSSAAAGCTGNTVATKSNVSVKLKFWHTYHPAYDTSCIGTVEVSFFAALQNASSARFRIYAHSLGGAKYKAYSHFSHNSGKHYFADGVHRSFGYPPIQVCVAAVNTNTGIVTQGPLCKSVG